MRRALAVGIGTLVLLVGACSDDSNSASGDGDGTPGAGNDATSAPAGGGASALTFNGEMIEFVSALCELDERTFNVAAVAASEHRVSVWRQAPMDPITVQLQDANSLNWFPEDQDLLVTRRGGTFSAEPAIYRNNLDDRTIEASFRVECP